MNEYTEQRLRDELDAAIARAYKRKLEEWDAGGFEVTRSVSFDPQKNGHHIGEVEFFRAKDQQAPRRHWGRFDYVPQLRGEPAHWHRAHDSED